MSRCSRRRCPAPAPARSWPKGHAATPRPLLVTAAMVPAHAVPAARTRAPVARVAGIGITAIAVVGDCGVGDEVVAADDVGRQVGMRPVAGVDHRNPHARAQRAVPGGRQIDAAHRPRSSATGWRTGCPTATTAAASPDRARPTAPRHPPQPSRSTTDRDSGVSARLARKTLLPSPAVAPEGHRRAEAADHQLGALSITLAAFGRAGGSSRRERGWCGNARWNWSVIFGALGRLRWPGQTRRRQPAAPQSSTGRAGKAGHDTTWGFSSWGVRIVQQALWDCFPHQELHSQIHTSTKREKLNFPPVVSRMHLSRSPSRRGPRREAAGLRRDPVARVDLWRPARPGASPDEAAREGA